MRSLELLAPAKNLACGIAAINHGADAVYIGAQRFGARAAAGNSLDDIRQLCQYARPFGVRVYVTVNTILYDEELDATRQLLVDLQQAGVSAVLVQDMALLSLAPAGLPLHASTQTDNRTAEKVRWLRGLGFARVVLARELSIDEIAEIHRQVPDAELEVFVHGALCVSFSGLCYASQVCFSRSANRGECAQFCRMRFSLVDAAGKKIVHERYLLSLKDMNQSANLQALAEAGATSFKIEGRLKDEAYVKNVVAAYSEQLNALIRRQPDRYCRVSRGRCEYTFHPDLDRTFNRGYTTYFARGRQPAMVSFDTPKAIGQLVGTVKELRRDSSFNVAGIVALHNGDGLCYVNAYRELVGFRVNRVEGNRVWPYRMPAGLKAGVRLYRNQDQEMEQLLSHESGVRRIPITIQLGVTTDGFRIMGRFSDPICWPNGIREPFPDPIVSVSAICEHQKAQKPSRDNIIRQLSKLGDTVFVAERIDLADDFPYFIPNSLLADMRHRLVDALLADVTDNPGYSSEFPSFTVSDETPYHAAPSYRVPYLYNISNRLSQQFYAVDAPSAYELRGGDGPVMQCRHCLRYSLGYCVRHGGRRPDWHEPLSLVIGDGRRFRLEFDCANCQMNVYAT